MGKTPWWEGWEGGREQGRRADRKVGLIEKKERKRGKMVKREDHFQVFCISTRGMD